MDASIDIQLIGSPHDGKVISVLDKEVRLDEPVFMPFIPADSDGSEIAYAEYRRMIFGTMQGQILTWGDPHLGKSTMRNVVKAIIEGDRSSEGIWILQGSDMQGNLQMQPLKNIE